MKNQYPPILWQTMVCPYCSRAVIETDQGALCRQCNTVYPYTQNGAIDFRLQRVKSYPFEFQIGAPLPTENNFRFRPLPQNPYPAVDFADNRIPKHLSKELLDFFPRAQGQDSLALDIGCGNGINRRLCEFAGFTYAGIDFDDSKATMLGDAHALPFRENSFELVLSVAVLEHIRFPFVMVREAHRVLQPEGKFIGTVAFLEPFHQESYYHHTHLGVLNVLSSVGFQVDYIVPSDNFPGLVAQARGLFRRMPKRLSKALVTPLVFLHKLWWQCVPLVKHDPKENEFQRAMKFTGDFYFVATKKH